MHTHNGTLYPMLGVGAFMTMFWTGIVVGYELGLGCVTLLIVGLLSACVATVGVCELQRRDRYGLASEPGGRAPEPGRPWRGRPAGRDPGERSRPGPQVPVSMGGGLPMGPTRAL